MGRGQSPAAVSCVSRAPASPCPWWGHIQFGGGHPSRVTRLRPGRNPDLTPVLAGPPELCRGGGVGENGGCFRPLHLGGHSRCSQETLT